MLKKIIKFSCIAFFLVTAPFCVWGEEDKFPSEIRIGMAPTMGRDVVKHFQPLMDHLKKSLGTEVKAYSADDYAGIIKALAYKQVDFARLGPKSYIEAKEMSDVDILVCEVNEDGEAGYYGAVVSKKGSGIDTIEQAKGRIFAFTDPNSTSGYLIPSVLFARDFKIDDLKTYFKEIRFSGSHRASRVALKEGTIDVAAISTTQIYRLENEGIGSRDDFNILWKSELIPSDPICARKDLPENLKKAFLNAMLSFNEDKEGLKKMQMGGYQIAYDKTYNVIRELDRIKK